MRQQTVRYYNDSIYWFFNNGWHRDADLPAAYSFTDRRLFAIYYHQHDKCHRTTGPAYIHYEHKVKRYWYQDRHYGSLEEIQMVEACR